jgi:phytanoyl-CoA hydroxylase
MISNRAILTPEQVERFRTDGYLVVPELLTEAETSAFMRRVQEGPPITGYALHGHLEDDHYRALATHPRVAGGAAQILGGRPRVVQTMLLNKPPRGGQGIALHQDSHYLPNEPNTLMACWLAFTDTDPDNGGLCVVPSSHKGGLRPAKKNEDAAEHAAWETVYDMRDPDGREWKQPMFSFQIRDLDESEIVRLTVPRGGGVFFTGMTIHGSFANHSADRPRCAFAVHYVREDTWLYRRDVQDAMLVEI